MSNARPPKAVMWFSLKTLSLICICLVIIAGFAAWMLRPVSLDVRIMVEPSSLPRYDDYAGSSPLGAFVRITNVSHGTVWYQGLRGSPLYQHQQLVDGNWETYSSVITTPAVLPMSKHWTPLRPMESMTILVGPISEKAMEFRVGLLFTTERFAPTEGHWVFTPDVRLVQRGGHFFPEVKLIAEQEAVLNN